MQRTRGSLVVGVVVTLLVVLLPAAGAGAEEVDIPSLGSWSIEVRFDHSERWSADGVTIRTSTTTVNTTLPGVEFVGGGDPDDGYWAAEGGTWQATTSGTDRGSDVNGDPCTVTTSGAGSGSDVFAEISRVEPFFFPQADDDSGYYPLFFGLDPTVTWTVLDVIADFDGTGIPITRTGCGNTETTTMRPHGWYPFYEFPSYIPQTIVELLETADGTSLSGGHSGTRTYRMPGGGILAEETFTIAYTLVPGQVLDVDGDGVIAGDACPTVPGPASNNGCPVTAVDCDGEVDRRGYVVAEYTAEIDTLIGDPDVFGFDVSGKWCAVDGVIEVDDVAVQGYETIDPTIGGILGTLGFTFSYDPARSSATPLEDGAIGQIVGIGQFDACFDWTALLAGPIGKAAGRLATLGGRLVSRALLRSGSVEEIVASLSAKADDLAARAGAIVDRQLQGVPGGLATVIKANIDATFDQLDELLEPIVERALAQGVDIEQLSGRARRAAIDEIRGSVESEIESAVAGLLSTESCFEVWQPEVTITVPLEGASSVSIDGFTNPFLTVSGGVTTDSRPVA